MLKTNKQTNLPGVWSQKASRSNYSHIRQSRFHAKIRRDKEGHYILIKGAIQQEDITILSIYIDVYRYRYRSIYTSISISIYVLNISTGPQVHKKRTSEFKET
jgi:hypothetical protein